MFAYFDKLCYTRFSTLNRQRKGHETMKLILLILYFAVLIAIGLYCCKHATDVNGFVLGGRSVGPWLTAFAYGTSYFSAVVFVGYAGQFGWKYGIAATDRKSVV